jgi:hypothetical protein
VFGFDYYTSKIYFYNCTYNFKKGWTLDCTLWSKSTSHSKPQASILITDTTHTHTPEEMWVSYWGSTTDTPQSKRTPERTSRLAFEQFDLKGTINSKQTFMHPLQIWTHPLGI